MNEKKNCFFLKGRSRIQAVYTNVISTYCITFFSQKSIPNKSKIYIEDVLQQKWENFQKFCGGWKSEPFLWTWPNAGRWTWKNSSAFPNHSCSVEWILNTTKESNCKEKKKIRWPRIISVIESIYLKQVKLQNFSHENSWKFIYFFR